MNHASGDFPDLSGTEATRDTLRAYSRVLSAIRREHAPPHPRWWHVSLRVGSRGLQAPPVPWPDRASGSFEIDLDLEEHRVVVRADKDILTGPDLREGLTASGLGERLQHLLHGAGIPVAPERDKYADATRRTYDPMAATSWLRAFQLADGALEGVQTRIDGDRGPVQLWPHHFDLAFEWFGPRRVEYVEDGERHEASSQIGFGFSGMPAGEDGTWPYFYATPWPFEPEFVAVALPSYASWATEGWQGAKLPYAEVCARGGAVVDEFCRVVYDACAPRLS